MNLLSPFFIYNSGFNILKLVISRFGILVNKQIGYNLFLTNFVTYLTSKIDCSQSTKNLLYNLMDTIFYSSDKKSLSIQLFLGAFIFSVIFSSCSMGKKTSVYFFKNIKADTSIQIAVNENMEVLVKKKDIISINISALNPEEDKLFNITQTYNSVDGKMGYLVDSNGNIQLHKLGNVHVEGLSLRQISEKLEKELVPYLKDPIAVVTFINKKVLVFGEVINPQVIPISDNGMTVLEAIVTAGGINGNGDNKNILVVRDEDGKKNFKYLNFEDVAVFNSKWYHLKPEDIVYVQVDTKRNAQTDKLAQRQSIISTVLAGTSLFFLIFDRLISK